ncbi:MAG: SUMF1/EgtB/PvdO family nonheme iron enzyme [Sedimentisphaerales bacterium]
MATASNILKWAGQLNCNIPLLHTKMAQAACRKLAADKSPQAVPFLVSALAHNDEQVRMIAENGLKSLSDPQAIDALLLGYVFTKQESVRRILTALGRKVTEAAELPAPSSESAPATAVQAWQFRNDKDGSILAFVPEGDFLAGKDNFSVHLRPYYLALTCVTNAQYARFLTERRPNSAKLTSWINLRQASAAIQKEGHAYQVDPEKAELPVIWVTWEGAAAYCKWAGLRLPSELEWEKGARGVDGRLYPWGDEWEAGRPMLSAGERKPEEISSVWAHPAARSPYGLYQMIGNVYEWCADPYEENVYQRYSQGDLRPPLQGEHRVLRGGPWRFGTPAHLRTEYRKGTVWRAGTFLCGFRCAKSL